MLPCAAAVAHTFSIRKVGVCWCSQRSAGISLALAAALMALEPSGQPCCRKKSSTCTCPALAAVTTSWSSKMQSVSVRGSNGQFELCSEWSQLRACSEPASAAPSARALYLELGTAHAPLLACRYQQVCLLSSSALRSWFLLAGRCH
eukprot:9000-Heterococcus_DN1.PRE.2